MADHRHAHLSPSAAHRWMVCPASIRMEQNLDVISLTTGSVYADEGTMAHNRAYLQAALAFKIITKRQYNVALKAWAIETPEEYHEDMAYYAELYTQFLIELMDDYPHSNILLEQRVDPGIPGCWGTADAIIVSPTHVHTVDYKYGKGIEVDADENPQLMLYSLGALEGYGDVLGETEVVKMSIFQPRLGLTSHFALTAKELRDWRENIVKPVALEALSEHARFNPTDEACRFCPAAGECKARMMKFTRMDFGDPDVMTVEDLSSALGQIEEIRRWCADIEDTALDKLYSQRIPIPGWKVVRSGGRRGIKDVEAATKALVDFGYDEDEVTVRSMKNLGDLERLVGKKVLPEVLGDLLVKGEGKPSLAREDDIRPSITPHTEAAKDFADTGEE